MSSPINREEAALEASASACPKSKRSSQFLAPFKGKCAFTARPVQFRVCLVRSAWAVQIHAYIAVRGTHSTVLCTMILHE